MGGCIYVMQMNGVDDTETPIFQVGSTTQDILDHKLMFSCFVDNVKAVEASLLLKLSSIFSTPCSFAHFMAERDPFLKIVSSHINEHLISNGNGTIPDEKPIGLVACDDDSNEIDETSLSNNDDPPKNPSNNNMVPVEQLHACEERMHVVHQHIETVACLVERWRQSLQTMIDQMDRSHPTCSTSLG